MSERVRQTADDYYREEYPPEYWELKRLFEKPIENWAKVARSYKRMRPCNDQQSNSLLNQLVNNLYDEVWEEPEKIAFFRDNVVDLNDPIPYMRSVIRDHGKRYKRELGRLREIYTNAIVTADSVLSYIALKDHGFRINRRCRGAQHAAVTLLTTKVLSPGVLFPILSSGRLSRTGKLILLNSILDAAALPDLLGPKESGAFWSTIIGANNGRRLVELVLGAEGR